MRPLIPCGFMRATHILRQDFRRRESRGPSTNVIRWLGAAEGIEEVKTLDILCVAGYSCLFSVRIETPDVLIGGRW